MPASEVWKWWHFPKRVCSIMFATKQSLVNVSCVEGPEELFDFPGRASGANDFLIKNQIPELLTFVLYCSVWNLKEIIIVFERTDKSLPV